MFIYIHGWQCFYFSDLQRQLSESKQRAEQLNEEKTQLVTTLVQHIIHVFYSSLSVYTISLRHPLSYILIPVENQYCTSL